jgi:tRNA wybutosine-synthesizing protein 4
VVPNNALSSNKKQVMSNVLCQVRGQKRLLLFPPSDVQYFDFAPGASSSSVDAFGDLTGTKAAATHPYEANLNPGDVLFLPSLWLHTAKPLDGVSVSVNVFFRGLQHGYAAGKDVYGNRDLQAYEKGRQDIGKVSKIFDNLPLDTRRFYLLRLADELSQKAHSI